ncbi:MAG: hypothetical protein ACE5KH_05605, partial [Candidatus Geothermarchaeales archaeon]
KETGVDGPNFLRWKNPLIHRLSPSIYGMRAVIPTKLGFKRRFWAREDLRAEPLKATYLNFPVMSDPRPFEQVSRYVEKGDLPELHRIFQRQEGDLLDALENASGIILAYVERADIMSHFAVGDVGRLKADTYFHLDALGRKVREELNWVLIVSDHGSREGIYTSYGFWSCTHRPPKQVMSILDFYPWLARGG